MIIESEYGLDYYYEENIKTNEYLDEIYYWIPYYPFFSQGALFFYHFNLSLGFLPKLFVNVHIDYILPVSLSE